MDANDGATAGRTGDAIADESFDGLVTPPAGSAAQELARSATGRDSSRRSSRSPER
jgi:hypothetical protein